jgi:hypothetical protein
VVAVGSQDKGRAHTGDIGIGRKPKHSRGTNTETLKGHVIMSRGSGTNVKIS